MTDIMLESIYRAIGERVEARRRAFRVTQAALAQKTLLPVGRIRQIEKGESEPSIAALYGIAKVLCCPVSWLLPDEAPKNEMATECLPAKTVTQ
jgi:transcriptional regulator with XRE-family HTH domain